MRSTKGLQTSRRTFGLVFVAVVVLLLLAALMLSLPEAEAADDWDLLVPDEYGLAVFVVPAVVDVERATPTLSWEAFSVNDWGAYATILRPYWRPGFGLDAGKVERKVRFGGGYLDPETWGAYIRRAF